MHSIAEIPGRVCEYATLVSAISQLQSKGATETDVTYLNEFVGAYENARAPIGDWKSSLQVISAATANAENKGFAGTVLGVVMTRFWHAINHLDLTSSTTILRFLCELVANRVLSCQTIVVFLKELLESTDANDFTVLSYHSCYLVLSALTWLGDVLAENELLPPEEISAASASASEILQKCTSFVNSSTTYYNKSDATRRLTDTSRGAGVTGIRFEQSQLYTAWESAFESLNKSHSSRLVNRIAVTLKEHLCSAPLPEQTKLPVFSWLWPSFKCTETVGESLGVGNTFSPHQTKVYPYSPLVTLVGPSEYIMQEQTNVETSEYGHSVALSTTATVASALTLDTCFRRVSLLWTARKVISETIVSHYPFHSDAAAALFSLEDYLVDAPVVVLAIEDMLLLLSGALNTLPRYHTSYYIAVLVDIISHDVSQRERRQEKLEERVEEGKRLKDTECSAAVAFGIFMRILFKRLPWLGSHVWISLGNSLSHYLNNVDYNFIWVEWMHVFDASYYGFNGQQPRVTFNLKKIMETAGAIMNISGMPGNEEELSPAACISSLVEGCCLSSSEDARSVLSEALALQLNPQYQLVRSTLNHIAAYMSTWKRREKCGQIFPRGRSVLVPVDYPEAVHLSVFSPDLRAEILNRLKKKEEELILGQWLWSLPDERATNVTQACSWRACFLLETIIVYGQATYRNIRILLGRYARLLRAFTCVRVAETVSNSDNLTSLSQAGAEDTKQGPFLLVEREVHGFGNLENMMITFHEIGPKIDEPVPDETKLGMLYNDGTERQENISVVTDIYTLCHKLWSAKLPEETKGNVAAQLATVGFAGKISAIVVQQCIECCTLSPANVIRCIGDVGGPTSRWLNDLAGEYLRTSIVAIPNDTWECLFNFVEIAHGELDSARDASRNINALADHVSTENEKSNEENGNDSQEFKENQVHYFQHKRAHANARLKRAEKEWHRSVVAAVEVFLKLQYKTRTQLQGSLAGGAAESARTGLAELSSFSHLTVRDQLNAFLRKWGSELPTSVQWMRENGAEEHGQLILAAIYETGVGEIDGVPVHEIKQAVSDILNYYRVTLSSRHDSRLKRDEGVPFRF